MKSTISMVALLMLFATGCGSPVSQVASSDPPPDPPPPPTQPPPPASPTAILYIQTAAGVNVYDVDSNAELTLVSGSPFATSGELAGTSGGSLVTVGTDYLHVYPVTSLGAIGSETSTVNTQAYPNVCGPTDGGAVNNGNVYVLLDGNGCSTIQAYSIASGVLTYTNEVDTQENGDIYSLPIFTSSTQAYSITGQYDWGADFTPFTVSATGGLTVETATETDLLAPPCAVANNPTVSGWAVWQAAAANNYLAVLGNCENGSPVYSQTEVLASYSVDGQGDISTSNSYSAMPQSFSGDGAGSMTISSDGLYLATSSDVVIPSEGWTGGIQLFRVNGANPLTPLGTTQIPTVTVDQISWDSQGKLYALSVAAGELYVYEVTAQGAEEMAGSPWQVGNTGVMVVQ